MRASCARLDGVCSSITRQTPRRFNAAKKPCASSSHPLALRAAARGNTTEERHAHVKANLPEAGSVEGKAQRVQPRPDQEMSRRDGGAPLRSKASDELQTALLNSYGVKQGNGVPGKGMGKADADHAHWASSRGLLDEL